MVARSGFVCRILSCVLAIVLVLILFPNFLPNYKYHNELSFVDTTRIPQFQEGIRLETLVDLTDFQYKIDNSLCEKNAKDLLGVIIVTSYVGHDELRVAHREAISQNKLQKMGFLRVFLLAEIPAKEKYIKQSQIVDEHKKFGDLLQGNFVEAYRNLTYKHIMGLKWAVTKCFRAKFIIKADDDTVFDIFHIKKNLEIAIYPNIFFAGFVLDNGYPFRNTTYKYFVSIDEYPKADYPYYLPGALYITNPSTAAQVVRQSQTEKLFWVDDVWVTGVLRKQLAIPLIYINWWYTFTARFLKCCLSDLKEFSYKCPFIVGPNDGDTKLIVDFLHEVEKCYFGECKKRPRRHPLTETCSAASAKPLLPDRGMIPLLFSSGILIRLL